PKLNSILACQSFCWAYKISILYVFPFSTLKGTLEGRVRQLLYFCTDSPFTRNSKAPVAPPLNTISSSFAALNSVSYRAENPSSFTPGANSCCPAVVSLMGSVICCTVTTFPERSLLFQ